MDTFWIKAKPRGSSLNGKHYEIWSLAFAELGFVSSVPRWQEADNRFDWFLILGEITSLPEHRGLQRDCSWGRLLMRQGIDWIISVPVALLIAAKLHECWNAVWVCTLKTVKHSIQWPILSPLHVQISPRQDLPIKIGSSKVQCSLNWMFNNKQPLWVKKSESIDNHSSPKVYLWLDVLVSYYLSISYCESSMAWCSHEPAAHFLSSSTMLRLYSLVGLDAGTCSKNLGNWARSIIYQEVC